jgi:hypothetical protein
LNRLYDGAFQRDIREDPQSHFEIMDNSDYVFYNISEGLKAMDELRFAIDDPGARIDFRYIPFWAKSLEKYRWPATMALQCNILILKNNFLFFQNLLKSFRYASIPNKSTFLKFF